MILNGNILGTEILHNGVTGMQEVPFNYPSSVSSWHMLLYNDNLFDVIRRDTIVDFKFELNFRGGVEKAEVVLKTDKIINLGERIAIRKAGKQGASLYVSEIRHEGELTLLTLEGIRDFYKDTEISSITAPLENNIVIEYPRDMYITNTSSPKKLGEFLDIVCEGGVRQDDNNINNLCWYFSSNNKIIIEIARQIVLHNDKNCVMEPVVYDKEDLFNNLHIRWNWGNEDDGVTSLFLERLSRDIFGNINKTFDVELNYSKPYHDMFQRVLEKSAFPQPTIEINALHDIDDFIPRNTVLFGVQDYVSYAPLKVPKNTTKSIVLQSVYETVLVCKGIGFVNLQSHHTGGSIDSIHENDTNNIFYIRIRSIGEGYKQHTITTTLNAEVLYLIYKPKNCNLPGTFFNNHDGTYENRTGGLPLRELKLQFDGEKIWGKGNVSPHKIKNVESYLSRGTYRTNFQ